MKGKAIGFIQKFYLLIVLLILCVFFSVLTQNFLTVTNLTNVFLQNAYMIIASTGVAMIMISGGADLSVSYQMALASVISAIAMTEYNVPVVLAVLIGLIVGAILGAVNGMCTIKLKMHPMVVTLGMMTVYQGLAYLITNAKSYYGFPELFTFFGQGNILGVIPCGVAIMFIMLAIAYFVLEKTYFGRYIYAIGGNEEATYLAGINTKLIRIGCFVMAGVYVAVSALVLTARTGSSSPSIGGNTVFDSITACVLGGERICAFSEKENGKEDEAGQKYNMNICAIPELCGRYW